LPVDEIKRDATTLVIQSVGWVLRETDDALTLVAHIHKEAADSVRYASDPITIPKFAIQMRRILRKR
jgi:hypothetical protein